MGGPLPVANWWLGRRRLRSLPCKLTLGFLSKLYAALSTPFAA